MFRVIFLGLLSVLLANATLNPEGTKCGKSRCKSTEFCSPFDTQCRPCANICEATSHNHQPELCVKDCQEFLHDQRYVLRTNLDENNDLKGEIQKLKILVTVALTLTCLSILAVIFLLFKNSLRGKKISKMLQRSWFRNKWIKKPTNNNKVQDDAEVGGAAKQNGLKLTLPTVSATVVESQSTTGNATPNTTSTPLSRRHPSEDATLDYAYDNPAMTPSPEAVQPRTKRESTF